MIDRAGADHVLHLLLDFLPGLVLEREFDRDAEVGAALLVAASRPKFDEPRAAHPGEILDGRRGPGLRERRPSSRPGWPSRPLGLEGRRPGTVATSTSSKPPGPSSRRSPGSGGAGAISSRAAPGGRSAPVRPIGEGDFGRRQFQTLGGRNSSTIGRANPSRRICAMGFGKSPPGGQGITRWGRMTRGGEGGRSGKGDGSGGRSPRGGESPPDPATKSTSPVPGWPRSRPGRLGEGPATRASRAGPNTGRRCRASAERSSRSAAAGSSPRLIGVRPFSASHDRGMLGTWRDEHWARADPGTTTNQATNARSVPGRRFVDRPRIADPIEPPPSSPSPTRRQSTRDADATDGLGCEVTVLELYKIRVRGAMGHDRFGCPSRFWRLAREDLGNLGQFASDLKWLPLGPPKPGGGTDLFVPEISGGGVANPGRLTPLASRTRLIGRSGGHCRAPSCGSSYRGARSCGQILGDFEQGRQADPGPRPSLEQVHASSRPGG